MSNEINDKMRKINADASSLWDQYTQVHDTKCPDGCVECCEGHFVPIWVTEIALIKAAIAKLPRHILEKQLPLARRHQKLHRKVRKRLHVPLPISLAPEEQREDLAELLMPELAEMGNEPCVLLGKKGCMIYDDRPFLCRLYGYPTHANPANVCEIFFDYNRKRKGVRVLPLVEPGAHNRVTAMPMALADTLGDHAYDFTVLPELLIEVVDELNGANDERTA